MNPLGIPGMPPREKGEEDVTEKQIEFLHRLGSFSDSEIRGLGKWQASFLIDHLLAERGDAPKQRTKRSGCFPIMLFLIAAGTGVWWMNKGDVPETPAQGAQEQPASAEVQQPPPAHIPRVPLFHSPSEAIKVMESMGLRRRDGEPPIWRQWERGWYSLARIAPPEHQGIEIVCAHTSSVEDKVELATWTVNQPAQSETGSDVFLEMCETYCRKLGCPYPAELFSQSIPEGGRKIETPDAVFELGKEDSKSGNGIAFRVRAK